MTGSGMARAELDGEGSTARFLLVLTHGAGGSTGSPDILAVRDAALGLSALVARITQPYRVRGARAPGSAIRQDAAWVEIVAALTALVPSVPLVQGGRSNGARVACRTATAVSAQAGDADRVVVVPGETHSLKGHRAVIAGAVTDWLPCVLRLVRIPAEGERRGRQIGHPAWRRQWRITPPAPARRAAVPPGPGGQRPGP